MKLALTTLVAGVALYAPSAWAGTGSTQTSDEEADAYQRDLEDSDPVEEDMEQPEQKPEEQKQGEVSEEPLMHPTQGEEVEEPIEGAQPSTTGEEHPATTEEAAPPVNVEIAPPPPVVIEEEKAEEHKGPGMQITAGGGVSGFSGDINNLADPGGAYTARLAVGTNRLLGLEVGYVGTAQNIDALGLDDSAVLVSNGIEGVARFNFGTTQLQPYVLGGVAWKRYDMVNDDFNTSDINDQDDVIEIPVGAGLAWRHESGFVLDGRGSYNFATQEDLVTGARDSNLESLDTWNVSLRAGVEF